MKGYISRCLRVSEFLKRRGTICVADGLKTLTDGGGCRLAYCWLLVLTLHVYFLLLWCPGLQLWCCDRNPDQSNVGQNSLFGSHTPAHHQGKSRHKPQRNAAYWLASNACFSAAQDHLPRGGIKKMPYRHAHGLILKRQFRTEVPSFQLTLVCVKLTNY